MARRPVHHDDPYAGDADFAGGGDDPDGPGEHDQHLMDDTQSFTVECPCCGEPISEYTQRCPHCESWISREEPSISTREFHRRAWRVLIVVLIAMALSGLVAFLFWT